MLAVLPGSTRASVVFFSNFGVAYTARITDIPASTGYGEPIQRFFKLKDGERIVAALSLDPRVSGRHRAEEGRGRAAGARRRGDERRLQPALQPRAVRRAEHARRAALRAGGGEGAEVVGVARVTGGEILIAATREARAMLCKVDEVNFLSGPGRGVILIKLDVDRGPRARLHRVDRRSRPDDGRDQPRRRADDQHHASTRSPAAAARAASCCSAASSPGSSTAPPEAPPPLGE